MGGIHVVGAEKMFFPEKREAMLAAFKGGTDIHEIAATEKKIHALATDVIPDDVQATAERSFFMDVYAAFGSLGWSPQRTISTRQ